MMIMGFKVRCGYQTNPKQTTRERVSKYPEDSRKRKNKEERSIELKEREWNKTSQT